MILVKSTSLDIYLSTYNNHCMNNERIIKHDQSDDIREIVSLWNQGKRFDEDGYEDLGFTLQDNALLKASTLDISARKIIADILFPTN